MVGIGTKLWAGLSRNGGSTECPAVSFHESLRANTNSKDRQTRRTSSGADLRVSKKFKYYSRHNTMQWSCIERGEVRLHIFPNSCHHTKRKSQLRTLLYARTRVQIPTGWDAVGVLDQARIWWGRRKIISPGKKTPVIHPAFNLHNLLLFTPTLFRKKENLQTSTFRFISSCFVVGNWVT